MPRSALLCPKIKIWAVTGNLGLEIECSERKNRAAAKTNFATAPIFYALVQITAASENGYCHFQQICAANIMQNGDLFKTRKKTLSIWNKR